MITSASPIRLLFTSSVPEVTRLRTTYTFRVFAAIYNHQVVEDGDDPETRILCYGALPPPDSSNSLWIPARYAPRSAIDPLPVPGTTRFAGENICLFHGLDPSTGRPDWLGEIFEWLSSSHEPDLGTCDSMGSVPISEMIFGRAGLQPWKPYAALHMAWLEHTLQNPGGQEGLPKAPSPDPEADHLVVSSHDVDFYFTDRRTAMQRLVKNLGISALVYRSASYFQSNLEMIGQMLAGERTGDYLPPLIKRMEHLGARSTFFIVPGHGHRRDPDYSLERLAPQLREAVRRGFPVEIHGSYKSIVENHTLLPERHALENVTGKKVLGSRQHWLRFDTHQKLFQAVEQAGLVFDSSLGFNDAVGFRNGACFAFPPYDFRTEKPHDFLEIPLAVMDGGLLESVRSSGESAQSLADRVLGESRKCGWGGVSVLWHNPIEALSVPKEINQVFWNCLDAKAQFREKWLSTDQFLSLCLPRFQNAGLLEGVSS